MNYLKHTLALLKKKKLFSAITILGITIPLFFLMIIITATVHFMSYDPPQSNFDRVVIFNKIEYKIKRETGTSNSSTYPSYHFIKNYIKTMKSPAKIGVISQNEYFNCYLNNKKARLKTVYTDGEFWEIADFKFIEGRAFNSRDVENSQQVAVIDKFTKDLVFGDKPAVGNTMRIFNKNYIIVGVVKNVDISRRLTHSNIWFPITTSNSYMVKDIMAEGCIGLLLANSTQQMEEIRSEFTHIINNFDLGDYEGLTKIDGEMSVESFNVRLKIILNNVFAIQTKKTSVIYIVFTIILFFFVILPVINLLYIHSSRINERSSEIGVRKSFGGSEQKLSRQFVIENIIITVFSGVLSLCFTLLVFWLLNNTQIIPGMYLSVKFSALLICFGVWLFFGIASGYFPAKRMGKLKIIDALHQKEAIPKLTLFNRKIKRLKLVLVLEYTLTFFSLVLIMNFVIRFYNQNSHPLGFDYHNIYQLSITKYDNQSGWIEKPDENDEIKDIVKSQNFIESYGKWQWNEPYHDGYATIQGKVKWKEKSTKDNIHLVYTGENMDKILGLEITEGRWFNQADERPDFLPAVISRTFKNRLFGNENAIGEYINYKRSKCRVIGIIDHYKYKGEFSTPVDLIFVKGSFKSLSINSSGRTRADFFRVKPGTTPKEVNKLARLLSQKFPSYEINITSLESDRTKYLHKTLGPTITIIVVFFLVIAIVLLGLFGVLWYDISLRKQELGVRRATGATSIRIFRLVVSEMLVWATLGVVSGIILFTQLPVLNLLNIEIKNMLVSIILSASIIYILILLCSLIPAIQASKIQPAEALHEE